MEYCRDSSALLLCCVSCGKLLCVSPKMASPLGWWFILAGGMQRPEPSIHSFFSDVTLPWGRSALEEQGMGEWILSSTSFMEVSCRLGWGRQCNTHSQTHWLCREAEEWMAVYPVHYLLYSLQCWQTSSVPCSSLCFWIHGLVTTYLASSQSKQGS